MQGLSLWGTPETKGSWFGSFLSGTNLSQSSLSAFEGFLSEALRPPPNSAVESSASHWQTPIVEVLGERRPLEPLSFFYEDNASSKQALAEFVEGKSGLPVSMKSFGNSSFSKDSDSAEESQQVQNSVLFHPLALLANLSVEKPVALIVQNRDGQSIGDAGDASPVTLVFQPEQGNQKMAGILGSSNSDTSQILVDLPIMQDAEGKRLPVFAKFLETITNEDSTNKDGIQPKDSALLLQGVKLPVLEGVLTETSGQLMLSFSRMEAQQNGPPVFSVSSEKSSEAIEGVEFSPPVQNSGKSQTGSYTLTLRFPVQQESVVASSKPITSEDSSEVEWYGLQNLGEDLSTREVEVVSLSNLLQKFNSSQESMPVQVGFDPSTGIVFLTSQQDTPKNTQVNAGEPSSKSMWVIQETLPSQISSSQIQADSGFTGKDADPSKGEFSKQGVSQMETQNSLSNEQPLGVRLISSDSSQPSFRVWTSSSDVPSDGNQPALMSLNSPEVGQFRQILDLLNVLGGSVEQISLSNSGVTMQYVSLEAVGGDVSNSETWISSNLQNQSPNVVTQGTGKSLNQVASDVSSVNELRTMTSESTTIEIPPHRSYATLESLVPILEEVFPSGQTPGGQVQATTPVLIEQEVVAPEQLIAMRNEERLPPELIGVPTNTQSLEPKSLVAMRHEEPLPPPSNPPIVAQSPKPIPLQAMQSYELIPPEAEISSQSQASMEKPVEVPVLSKVEIQIPTEPINLIAKPVDISQVYGQWANGPLSSQEFSIPEEMSVQETGLGKVIVKEPSQGTAEFISAAESKVETSAKPEGLVMNPSRPVQRPASGFKATGFAQPGEISQVEIPDPVSLVKELRPIDQLVKPSMVQPEGKTNDSKVIVGKESSLANSIQQPGEVVTNSARLNQPVFDVQQGVEGPKVTGNISSPPGLQQPMDFSQPVRMEIQSGVQEVFDSELKTSSQPIKSVASEPVFTQGSQPIRFSFSENRGVTPRDDGMNSVLSFQSESNPIPMETRFGVDPKAATPVGNPAEGSSSGVQPDLMRLASTPSMSERISIFSQEGTTPTGSVTSSHRWDLQAMVQDSLFGSSVDQSPPETMNAQSSPPKGISSHLESTQIEMPPSRSFATLEDPQVLSSEGESGSGKVEVRQPQVESAPIALGKSVVRPEATQDVVPIQMSEFTGKSSGSSVKKEPILHSGIPSTPTESVRTHSVGRVYPNEPVIVPEAPVQVVQEIEQSEALQKSGLESTVNKTPELKATKEEWSLKSEARSPESTSSLIQQVSGVRSSQGTDVVQQVKGMHLNPGIPEGEMIVEQIVRQVNQRITPGGGEMRLQLVPEDLGKIRIQVGVEDGIVRARIVTETSEARSLLERHVSDLKIALGEQGLRVQEVKLTLAGGGEDYMAGSQGQSQNHRYSGSQPFRTLAESSHYSQDQQSQGQEKRPYPERWEKLLGNGQGHVDYRA